MLLVDEVIRDSIAINLYLSDQQKRILSFIYGKNKSAYDNFFRTCKLLGKKDLNDGEFFSLSGIRDRTEDIFEHLIKGRYKEYLSLFDPFNSILFTDKLKRKVYLYEKYSVIKDNFDSSKLVEDVETTNSFLYFAGKERNLVKRLCFYLSSVGLLDFENFRSVYIILNGEDDIS